MAEMPRGGKKAKVEKPAHLGAYVFWASENRRAILARYNLQNSGDLRAQSSCLSAAWHSLTESERKQWTMRAQQFNLVAEIEFARGHPENKTDTRKLTTQLAKLKRDHGDLLAGVDVGRYLAKQSGVKQPKVEAEASAASRKRPNAANSIAKLDETYTRAATQRASQLTALRSQLDTTRIQEFSLLDLAAVLRISANALSRVGKSLATQNLPPVLAERSQPTANQNALADAATVAKSGADASNASANDALYNEALDTLISCSLCALSSLTCLTNFAVPQRGNDGAEGEASRQKAAEDDDLTHSASFEQMLDYDTCCSLLETVSYVLPESAFTL